MQQTLFKTLVIEEPAGQGGQVQRLVSRTPVDFRAIAKESGLSKGKLCYSPAWGWCVQNTHGIDGPSVGCITAPEVAIDQTLKLEDNHWCIYG